MKHQWSIACIGIVVAIFAGCAEPKHTGFSQASNIPNVSLKTPNAPTRTPSPGDVREDANGNLINPDGWRIQEIIPKEMQRSTETGRTRKGRTVTYNVLTITPENRPEAEAIPPHELASLEWRVTEVAELSGRDGKIFCYVYMANPYPRNSNANGVAEVTRYRLCDYDGDGKYEFNGWGYAKFIIPDWVESNAFTRPQ